MTRSRQSNAARGVAAGLAVVFASAVVIVGTTASALGAPEQDPPVASKSAQDFPLNASGLRFGSALEARTPQDEPDLILAYGTKGQEGYLLKTDLESGLPKNPSEAVALSKRGPKTIPLYAKDGKTIIGEFVLS